MVAVDAVESGAAAGVFLEEREEAFHAALFARPLRRRPGRPGVSSAVDGAFLGAVAGMTHVGSTSGGEVAD